MNKFKHKLRVSTDVEVVARPGSQSEDYGSYLHYIVRQGYAREAN